MQAALAFAPAAPAFNMALASPQQGDIFDWFRSGEKGNLVVRARAGCGKTTTILAGVELAPEAAILLAAFNKDIADELRSRITNQRVEAKTLHALGFQFVRYRWKGIKVEEGGNRRERDLAEAATKAIKGGLPLRAARNNPVPDEAIKLVGQLHSKGREIRPFARNGGDLVELMVTFNLIPDEALTAAGWSEHAICLAAHRAMELARTRPVNTGIDYSDMIYLPLVNDWVRAWYDLVVIDEAQDMTEAQLELALRACRRTGRIAVVGDDRQGIYGFRGADSSALDNLKRALKARELGLTITRRCPKNVVELAKALVPDFEAAPTAPEGTIRRCDGDAMVADAAPGDFIISRKNAPLVPLCLALLKRGVRARVKGRDIGRGIQALLRKLDASSLDELEHLLANWITHETARAMKLPEDTRDARIEFVQDQAAIIHALADGAGDLDGLNRRILDLFSDEKDSRAVILSTVHRVKGLEASRIYLLEGTFRTGSLEEDNIRYVAITRTKDTLVWVEGFE